MYFYPTGRGMPDNYLQPLMVSTAAIAMLPRRPKSMQCIVDIKMKEKVSMY